MEPSLWVSIVGICISAIIGPVVVLIVKRTLEKHDKEDKQRRQTEEELAKFKEEKVRAERKEDVQEAISKAITPLHDDLDQLKRGVQAGLRHDLYAMVEEWETKGWIPHDQKEDFNNMYQNYHALGKNGVMDANYDRIMALPEHAPRKKRTKKILNENK